MTTIKERTQLPARWTLLDADDVPIVPSTISYQVDCLTTGRSTLVSQTVPAASPVNIIIPASANAIISNANPVEVKRLTFIANAGLDTQITDYADYTVTNNRFTT